MRISDWSSDVCSSDLDAERDPHPLAPEQGTPPRRRLVEIHIVSNHRAPPSRREATLARGGAGSIYAEGWSDRRKVSGRNDSPIASVITATITGYQRPE